MQIQPVTMLPAAPQRLSMPAVTAGLDRVTLGDEPRFLDMTPRQWTRVGTIALATGLGSLALAPFGLAPVSQGIAGACGALVLSNGATNRGPLSDGWNALINVVAAGAGLMGVPMLGGTHGALAAALVTGAAAGVGAAVIGAGPIRNYSTGIVEGIHYYVRREDYQ